MPVPSLMFVAHPGPEIERIAEAAVKGGVNIVRLRKDPLGAGEWTPELTESLALRLRGRAIVLTCAADIGESPLIGDGIHLREADNRHRNVFDHPDLAGRLIGRSVHSVDAAKAAVERGADYLIAGTVYDTESHPGLAGSGVDHLHSICQAVDIPVIAIGGITVERVPACIEAGAAGVAIISPIVNAKNPRRIAAQYRASLDIIWRGKGG
ncbi:MAG TPA: thiamine phosphate synthase [Capsulimonadaceae bacterium]